jgi:hypothetical protein
VRRIQKRESVPDVIPELDDSISFRIARNEPSLQAVWDTMGPGAPPPAALYPAHRSQLSRLQRGAERLGLHMGAIPSPKVGLKREDCTGENNFIYNRTRRVSRFPSFWAVLGHDKQAVEHICELQRSRDSVANAKPHDVDELVEKATDKMAASPSPGLLRTDTTVYNLGTPRGLVFTQLVFATVIGGVLMFWMLSMV